MRGPRFLILIVVMALCVGCQDSKQPTPTSEVQSLMDFHGSSEAASWRLEDKREIVTPCTIGGTPLATFDLPLDTVDILNYYTVGSDVVILARWASNNVCRFVKVTTAVGSGAIEFNAQILTGQMLLYGLRMSYDTVNFSSISVKEYTLTDELEVVIEEQQGGGVLESYSFNGAPQTTFVRDADPLVYDLASLAAQIPGIQSPGVLEAVVGANSSLYANPEGARLVSLVESHDFAQWLYNEQQSGDLIVATNRWGLNDWLTGCTIIKCLCFGGFANPVCATCTVVSGGLWLAKAGVCLIDCSAWPPSI